MTPAGLQLLSTAGLILLGLGAVVVALRGQRNNRLLHEALQQANVTMARWHERALEGPAVRYPHPPAAATTVMPRPYNPGRATTRHHRDER